MANPPASPPSNSTATPPAPSPSNSTTTPSAPPPSNSTTTPPAPPPLSPPPAPPPSIPPVSPPPATPLPQPQPPPATPPRTPPTPSAPPPSNTTTPPAPSPKPPVIPPPYNGTTPSAPPPQSPSTPPSPPLRPGNPPSPSLNPPPPPSPPSPPTSPAPPGQSSSPPPPPGGSRPSSPSPQTLPPSSGSDSSSLQTSAIVGIIIGGVAVVAILALLFVFCFKKKRRRRDDGDDGYYAPPPPPRPKNDNSGGPPYHWQQAAPQAADHLYAGPPQPSPPPPNGLKPPPGPARHHLPPPPPPPHYFNSSSGGSGSNYSGSDNPVRPPQPGIAMGFSKSTFTYEELAMATDDFAEANLLGQGGFGYVHKGVLPSGKEVAIKSLKDGSGQGEREFQAEVEIISRVHHKHLVSLVGYCMEGSQRMLIYEFVPNNTLEFHLHGRGRPAVDWATRIKIATGSAKGLAYLHEDCQPKIIHRDIKAANILLDFKFEAKVADFGLAKLTSDLNTHVSTRVMGTFGYLAPEYASSGKLTEKSDVFSFGIMLLELITGKRPINAARTYMEDSLIDWARPLLTRALEDGNFDALVDPNLQNQYNHEQMARMIACAAACVRHSARRRPRMSQVVRTLEGDASLTDLSDGLTPGHSSAYSFGSSDYDNNQYKMDMEKYRKQIIGSQEHGPSSEYSGQTSEYGLNPSGSSSEGQHTREMKMGMSKNDSQGFQGSRQQ